MATHMSRPGSVLLPGAGAACRQARFALSSPNVIVRLQKIHEPKRARVVCLTSYTACIEGKCTEVVRVNPRDCPHSLMWHSCCVKLPIDGAAAWVIILRVVRSMIETAGVVQTPNGECSRTPMSSNRQWTEEVVVVYRLSTPTSDGPVLRLPPPCARRWRSPAA